MKRLDINEKLIFLTSYFSTTNVLTIKEINKEGNKKVSKKSNSKDIILKNEEQIAILDK